jgi:hypothetical protein
MTDRLAFVEAGVRKVGGAISTFQHMSFPLARTVGDQLHCGAVLCNVRYKGVK